MTIRIFNPEQRDEKTASGVIHQCDWCNRKGRWSHHWSWYGSYGEAEHGLLVKCCGCCEPSTSEAEHKIEMKRKRHD